MQVKEAEVNAGFRSRSSVISERGDDPETVHAERAADLEREKTLGLQLGSSEQAKSDDDPVAEKDQN